MSQEVKFAHLYSSLETIKFLLASCLQQYNNANTDSRNGIMIDTLDPKWVKDIKPILNYGKQQGWYENYKITPYGEELPDGSKWQANFFSLKKINIDKVREKISDDYDKHYLLQTEIYGENKQKYVMAEALLKKQERIGESTFVFTNGNFYEFARPAFRSTSFYRTLKAIEKDGYLSMERMTIVLYGIYQQPDFFQMKISLKGTLSKGDNPYEANSSKNKGTIELIKKKPIKLPKDTRWEHITIRFFDKHEVDISVKNEKFRTNYAKMGFQNNSTRRPNKQWEFLVELSKHQGETAPDLINAVGKKIADQLKSRKKLLANALKQYFGLQSDPFPFDYRDRVYRLKLHLKPVGGDAITSLSTEEIDSDIMDGAQDRY